MGTALFAVVLQHEFVRDFPVAGKGLGAFASIPPAQRAKAAPSLAAAFGHTFWWPLATAAVGTLAALLMLRERPRPTSEQAVRPAEEAPKSGTARDGSR
jgi:hypothetical protein